MQKIAAYYLLAREELAYSSFPMPLPGSASSLACTNGGGYFIT